MQKIIALVFVLSSCSLGITKAELIELNKFRLEETIPLGPAAGNSIGTRQVIMNNRENTLYAWTTKSISVIDRDTRTVLKSIQTEDSQSIAIDTTLNYLFINYWGIGVDVVDCQSNAIIGRYITNNYVISVDETKNRLISAGINEVRLLDSKTGKTLKIISDSRLGHITNIAVDKHNELLYAVSNYDETSKIFAIDLYSGSVIWFEEINTRIHPTYMAVDASSEEFHVVLAGDILSNQGSTYTIYDGRSGNRLWENSALNGNYFALDGEIGKMFINNNNSLDIYDLSSYSISSSIYIEGGIGIHYDEEKKKFVFLKNNEIVIIDVISESVDSILPNNQSITLQECGYNSRNYEMYFTDHGQNIGILEISTGNSIIIEIGKEYKKMILGPDSISVWILPTENSDGYDQEVLVIDLLTNSIINKIPTNESPLDLLMDNQKDKIIVPQLFTNAGDQYTRFSIINSSSRIIEKELDVSGYTLLSFIYPHTGYLYTLQSNNVKIIDVVNEKIIDEFYCDYSQYSIQKTGLVVDENEYAIDFEDGKIYYTRYDYSENKYFTIELDFINKIEKILLESNFITNEMVLDYELNKLYISRFNQQLEVFDLNNYKSLYKFEGNIYNSNYGVYYDGLVFNQDTHMILVKASPPIIINGLTDEYSFMEGEYLAWGNGYSIDEFNGRIFITMTDRSVLLFDENEKRIIEEFPEEYGGKDVIYNPKYGKIYVLNSNLAKITVLEDLEHPVSLPTAPETVEISPINEKIRLNWSKLIGVSESEQYRYNVYGAVNPSGPFLLLAKAINDTTFVNTDLTNGSTYYYRISSYVPSLNIEGNPTDVVSGTPINMEDFELLIKPNSLKLIPSGKAVISVHVESVENFEGEVNLSLIASFPGINAELDRTSLLVDSVALVSVEVSEGLDTGKYNLSLIGKSGSIEHKLDITLNVIEKIENASLLVDREELKVGEAAVISGLVSSGMHSVQINVTSPLVDTLLTASTDDNGKFRLEYFPPKIGEYSVSLAGEVKNKQTFQARQSETRISLSTDIGNDYVLGNSALVKGKITPVPSGSRIGLEMTSPSGERREELLDINEDGFFIREFNFSEQGNWYLKSYWTGNPELAASESGYLKVPVGIDLGKVIIVEGYGREGWNCNTEVVENLGKYAYNVLRSRRFSAEDIFYLSNRTDMDLNGDGIPDVDMPSSFESLKEALQSIVTEGSLSSEIPLLICLLGGGYQNGSFKFTDVNTMSYSDLSELLEGLEIATGVSEIVVLADKPQLSDFVTSLSGSGRIILAGNQGGDGTYIRGGLFSFSNVMLYNIYQNRDLYFTFSRATQSLRFGMPGLDRYRAVRKNWPTFDASGDGIFVDSDDRPLVSEMYFGSLVGLGDFAPVVEWTGKVSSESRIISYLASASESEKEKARTRVKLKLSNEEDQISGKTEIRARINDPEGALREGFAVLVSPQGEALETISLDMGEDQIFSGYLDDSLLTRPERYTIAVFGVDQPNNVSIPNPSQLIYLENNEILSIQNSYIEPGQLGTVDVQLTNTIAISRIEFNVMSSLDGLSFEGAEVVGDASTADLAFKKGIFGGGSVSLELGENSLVPDLRGRTVVRLNVSLPSDAVEGDSIELEVSHVELFDESGLPVLVIGVEGLVHVGNKINETLRGDLNQDGTLNIADVVSLLLLGRENPENPLADFNNDGVYQVNDAIVLLLYIRDHWNQALLSSTDINPMKLNEEQARYIWSVADELSLNEEEMSILEAIIGRPVLPQAFSLGQNYPNPFNPSTTINYSIPDGQEINVRLKIFDIRGALIQTLVNEIKKAGMYQIYWNGTDSNDRSVSSGVYFYQIQAGDFVQIKKMVLLK